MRLKIVILVSLIAICGTADALAFSQQISVFGSGNLSAKTDTDAAKDAVDGAGEQEYERYLMLQEGSTQLTSEYHLTSGQPREKNRYYTQTNSLIGLEHSVSVTSFSNVTSKSIIKQTDYEVDTSYNIKAEKAEMSEKITDLADLSVEKNGHKIVETYIKGDFVAKSEFFDDGGVKKMEGYNPQNLLNEMNAAEMAGEIPLETDGGIEILYGELDDEVVTEIEEGVVPLGMRTRYYQDRNETTIGARKIVFLGDTYYAS